MADFEVHPSGTATTLTTCANDVKLLAECLQMMFIISAKLESSDNFDWRQRQELCRHVDELGATLWNRICTEYEREAHIERDREARARLAKSAPFVRTEK